MSEDMADRTIRSVSTLKRRRSMQHSHGNTMKRKGNLTLGGHGSNSRKTIINMNIKDREDHELVYEEK